MVNSFFRQEAEGKRFFENNNRISSKWYTITLFLGIYSCSSEGVVVESPKKENLNIVTPINDDSYEMSMDEIFEYFPSHMSVEIKEVDNSSNLKSPEVTIRFETKCFLKDSLLTKNTTLFYTLDDSLSFDEMIEDTTGIVDRCDCSELIEFNNLKQGEHEINGVFGWSNSSYWFSIPWTKKFRID